MAVAAFVVSVLAFLVSAAGFAFNWISRAERAAEGVFVRLDISAPTDNSHGLAEADCWLVVVNHSQLPVNDVAASLYLPGRKIRYVASIDIIPPGSEARALVVKIDGCDVVGMSPRADIAVEFVDGKERRWLRDSKGRISRIGALDLWKRARAFRKVSGVSAEENLSWHGVWYTPELQEDGQVWMIGRDYQGVRVEFSHLVSVKG